MEIKNNLYDVIIIGGGVAGLTAALYLSRAHYRVIVIERETFGGQITITSEIVNYPGIEKTDGKTLTKTMRKQAQNFGAEFIIANAEKIDVNNDIKKVYTDKGIFESFGILIATGANPRTLGFIGEEKFKGHGVAYCATCDGEFFTGKEIFVIGGGFAAAEESVFLTKYASHVTILIREDDFACAKAVADSARNNKKITIYTNVEVTSVDGDSGIKKICYKNNITGEKYEYTSENNETIGVFVFAGYEPETSLIKDIVKLNQYGYIITDKNQKTNIDGLYAAGDVCEKSLRQIVTAVGDGAQAATELEKYAMKMQAETGFKPEFKINIQAQTSENITEKNQDTLFTSEMYAQLETVFSKMEKNLILKLYLDKRPVSQELKNYMESLASITDKLKVEIQKDNIENMPCVKICFSDGKETGLAFHGVPGGHEFTAFILGIYNVSCEGQKIDDELKRKITEIKNPTDIKIMVSLSCGVCPELVTAAQKIASENDFIKAEVFDLNHFPEMKQKYDVMSVPCMIINDSIPLFGKKNIKQIVNILSD